MAFEMCSILSRLLKRIKLAFNELFPHLGASSSRRVFKLYSSEPVSVDGSIFVKVRHNRKSRNCELSSVNATESVLPLMGQDWLDMFYPGWRINVKRNICAMHMFFSSTSIMEDVMKYFRPTDGKSKNMTSITCTHMDKLYPDVNIPEENAEKYTVNMMFEMFNELMHFFNSNKFIYPVNDDRPDDPMNIVNPELLHLPKPYVPWISDDSGRRPYW